MRKSLLILCFMLAIVGCRPRGVLSNHEMRDVLYDLHRVDGAMQIAGYNYGHDQEVAGYYKNVLDEHGITQAQFDSSLVWFTDNPQIFNKIYPKVVKRLQADFDREKEIREDNRDKRLLKNKVKSQQDKYPMLAAQQVEDVLKKYQNGYDNPWKIWVPKEFCEKNVIIFGQLEKK